MRELAQRRRHPGLNPGEMPGLGRDHVDQMIARECAPIQARQHRGQLRVVERRQLIDERTRARPGHRPEDLDVVHVLNNNRRHRQFSRLWTTGSDSPATGLSMS